MEIIKNYDDVDDQDDHGINDDGHDGNTLTKYFGEPEDRKNQVELIKNTMMLIMLMSMMMMVMMVILNTKYFGEPEDRKNQVEMIKNGNDDDADDQDSDDDSHDYGDVGLVKIILMIIGFFIVFSDLSRFVLWPLNQIRNIC